jgi:hypothetical protein
MAGTFPSLWLLLRRTMRTVPPDGHLVMPTDAFILSCRLDRRAPHGWLIS